MAAEKAKHVDVEAPSTEDVSSSGGEFATAPAARTVEDRPKLMLKIDLHLLPILTLTYLMAFLDRVNIGNAQVYGLSKDLGLKNTEYNTALCLFFVPYILFELPANALLKKIKPHVFLSASMFMFGVVTLAQGFVKSYSGLLATRFFLGFFETGVFPGCFYLLAMWYKREESQKRFTFFFISTALAGAFGGLIATGIHRMDGLHGKLAWRWVFIIEGAITCGVALLGFVFIPDFPEDAKWLTQEEKDWVKRRLREDVGSSGLNTPPVSWRDLRPIWTDFTFISNALMYFGFLVPLYGFSYFAPTITQSVGHYTAVQTQLHTVPIWAVAWGAAMIAAYFSDRLQHRYLFIMGPVVVGCVGLIVLLCVHTQPHVQYGMLFLALLGPFTATPICICWFSTNLAGHNRRAIGTAFQIAFGNVGGIIATFLFLAADAPRYTKGYAVCLSFCVLAMAAATVYFFGVRRENRRRDRGESRMVRDSEGDDVGDLARDYRYAT